MARRGGVTGLSLGSNFSSLLFVVVIFLGSDFLCTARLYHFVNPFCKGIDKVINEEVTRLMNEPVTEREIARAKNSYRSSFLNRIASVHGKADLLNEYNYLAGTPDYVQRDAARYDAVTRADVQRVARTYLGQHKLVLTVVPQGKRELMLTGNGGAQ